MPNLDPEQVTTRTLTLADQLWAAQVRVYEKQAEAAQARADLAHREAALNEALTQMNSVVTSLLLNTTGEQLGNTRRD